MSRTDVPAGTVCELSICGTVAETVGVVGWLVSCTMYVLPVPETTTPVNPGPPWAGMSLVQKEEHGRADGQHAHQHVLKLEPDVGDRQQPGHEQEQGEQHHPNFAAHGQSIHVTGAK